MASMSFLDMGAKMLAKIWNILKECTERGYKKNLLSFYDIFSNKLLLEKSLLPFPLLTSERVIVDINSTKKFDTIVTNDDTLLENFLLVENNSVGGFLLHFNLCLLDISFFDPLSNEHLVTNSP